MTTPNASTPLGGYSLVSVKEAGGEETARFEAYIALDGRRVMHVSNGGTGGCHRYGPVGPFKTDAAATKGYAAFRQAEAEFEAFAKQWNADTEYAGMEDADQLVNRLLEVAALNRMRRTLFLLDGDPDFSETGAAREIRGATFEQTVAMLSHPPYASRNPRVWDRQRSEFVPVV